MKKFRRRRARTPRTFKLQSDSKIDSITDKAFDLKAMEATPYRYFYLLRTVASGFISIEAGEAS